MTIRRFVVPLACDGSGDGIMYTPPLYGEIISLRYIKIDFASGVDFACTLETTGEGVWSESDVNASATRYPRAATHSTAGAAALYASGGVAVLNRIGVGGDRLKIVIAQGGVSKTGTLHVTING